MNVAASETRQHGVHEHGLGRLNVAVEGENVYLELVSPAANIVGFEHRPKNEEQEVAVRKSIKTLEEAEKLFSLTSAARCRLVEAKVETELLSGKHAHQEEDGAEHREHDEEHAGTHDAHEHEGESGEGEEHETHSEFEASYQFACARPDALEYLDVNLFSVFPGMEEIEAQLISGAGQTSADLTARSARVRF